jgi:hypothetical protein
VSLAGSDNQRNISAIALLALFLSFSSFSFVNLVVRPVACFPGDIGTSKCPLNTGTHDVVSLGTWANMPSTATELMGNTSYRAILAGPLNGLAGLSAAIAVGCELVSNTVGAQLQLQYALFSAANIIASGFQNIGSAVLIDGGGSSCQNGGWVDNQPTLLNSTASNQGYIFRVIGTGGGGAGDNPRFNFVSVTLVETVRRNYSAQIGSTTTTTISFQSSSPFAETSTKTVNVKWIVSNVTSATGCGTGDTCVESGTAATSILAGASSSATVTVTYPIALTGTVNGAATCAVASSVIVIPAGNLYLLRTETVTV